MRVEDWGRKSPTLIRPVELTDGSDGFDSLFRVCEFVCEEASRSGLYRLKQGDTLAEFVGSDICNSNMGSFMISFTFELNISGWQIVCGSFYAVFC